MFPGRHSNQLRAMVASTRLHQEEGVLQCICGRPSPCRLPLHELGDQSRQPAACFGLLPNELLRHPRARRRQRPLAINEYQSITLETRNRGRPLTSREVTSSKALLADTEVDSRG